MDAAFDKHTYKHTTMGFEKDIIAMPGMYDYSISFFKRYYRPENCVLLLVGDFDPAKAKEMIKEFYGGWQSGYVPPQIAPEPFQHGERNVSVDYPGRTLPLVWIGYKGDAFDPAEKSVAAAYLLADLAFGENSELYKKLVIREQKVQWVSGDFGFNRDPKLYDVYARVKKPGDIDYVIEEIDKTATRFRTELVSGEGARKPEEEDPVRLPDGARHAGRTAGGLARTIALTGGVEAIDTLYGTLASVTPEDIRAAANRYLQDERRTVLILKGE